MDAQEMSGQEQEVLAGDVMNSIGETNEAHQENENSSDESHSNSDPLYVQKRLKQQKRAHDREIRELRDQISHMQSGQQNFSEQSQQTNSSYSNSQEGSGIDDQIHRAVSYALQHKDMEERKAKDAERMRHVHQQYGELQKHLDHTADKYDDFDDVVRGHDVPYTDHMRDAALLLPRSGPGSAGEVLYKLGQNKDELRRISSLHPLDQASEMIKLSHALISGGSNSNALSNSKPMGNIKSNPVVNSHAINERTSVSDLRKRMRSGGKTW